MRDEVGPDPAPRSGNDRSIRATHPATSSAGLAAEREEAHTAHEHQGVTRRTGGGHVTQGPLVRKEWLIAMAIVFVALVAVLYVVAGSEPS